MADETQNFKITLGVDTSGYEAGIKAAEGFIKHLEEVYKQVAQSTAQSTKKTEEGTKKVGDAAEDAAEKTRKSADTTKRSFLELNQALEVTQKIATTTFRAIKDGFNLIGEGASANNIIRGFESIQASAGLVADDSLAKLRAALGGTVSDLDLMKQASSAALLGLDPAKFDQVAGAAARLGAAIGVDSVPAIQSLVEGLGRGSTEMLDNLGIVLRMNDAYKQYADRLHKNANDLTDFEKRQAFLTIGVEKVLEKVEGLAPPIEDAGRAYERLGASVGNARKDFVTAIAVNDNLRDSLDRLATTITNIDFEDWGRRLGDAMADAAYIANKTIVPLLQFTKWAIDVPANIRKNKVNDNISEYEQKLEKIQERLFQLNSFRALPTGLQAEKSQLEKSQAFYNERIKESKERLHQLAIETGELRIGTRGLATETDGLTGAYDKGIATLENWIDRNTQGSGKNKEAEKAAKEAAKALESLIDKRDALLAKAGTSEDLLGLSKAIDSGDEAGISRFAARLRDDSQKELRAGLADALEKAGPQGAQVFAQIVAAETRIAVSDALAESAKSVADAQAELRSRQLEFSLEDAFDKGDFQRVVDIQRQIREDSFQEQFRAEEKRLLQIGVKEATAKEEAYKVANARIAVDDLARARQLEEAYKQVFRNSSDFLADVLTPVLEDGAANFEDLFKDAGKRAIVGALSQVGASIATGLGLNLGKFSSAQGFGQSIAASLGFKGGGVSTLGDIFTNGSTHLIASATALDGSAVALTGAASALVGAAGAQALKPPQTPEIVDAKFIEQPGMETIITKAGIAVAAVAATALTAKVGYDSYKAGSKGGVGAGIRAGFDGFEDLAAAFASGGLSIPIQFAAGVFGGLTGGSRNKGELDRRMLRAALQEVLGQDLVFSGARGQQSLFDYSYNVSDFSASFGSGRDGRSYGDLVGLADPLAHLFVGQGVASGKFSADDAKVLSEQLSGMFTNALADSENFNEALITAQGLMRDLGIDAEKAKQDLVDLFFQGDIDLPEFGVDIRGLDQLGQTDLQGPTAEIDALSVAVANLDDNRRTAAEGMILWFKEIEESNIVSFFTDQLGPAISDSIQSAVTDGSISMGEFAQIGLGSAEQVAGFFKDRFGDEVGEAISSGLSDGALSFQELVDAGVVSTDQLLAYVDEKFGSDAASAFSGFLDAGVHSFEQLGQAIDDKNANIIERIFSLFSTYREGLQAVVDKNRELEQHADTLRRIGDNTRYAKEQQEAYNRVLGQMPKPPSGGSSGNDPNTPLNRNAAR